MKNILNQRVKFRENFRPFAPIVIKEKADLYFRCKMKDNPFMLFVDEVYPEKHRVIPAVTHVDGSARLQTVQKENNIRLYTLLKKFGEYTGIPVLLNTSFNIKGQPIVETPEDAVKAFISCDMDVLVIHNYMILKKKQSGAAI